MRTHTGERVPPGTWLVLRRDDDGWVGSLRGPGLVAPLEARSGRVLDVVAFLADRYEARVAGRVRVRPRTNGSEVLFDHGGTDAPHD